MEKLEHTPMSDNELIDQFMEAKPAEDIPYDTNWNLLMPVVEKIESLGFKVAICKDNCTIDQLHQAAWPDGKPIAWSGSVDGRKGKLSAVHEAIVEFIKWHNAEKLKHKQP